MFVHETNSPSFQQLSQEMKQKRALHNKPHKMGRKGYRGKRKDWDEEDANLATEGKQNPWGPISWMFKTLFAGKGWEEEEEY
jgi:hypothetical protein